MEWGPAVGEELRGSEQENQRMRELTRQTHVSPCTGKSCSKVVTIHFIQMLADSEIVP